MRARNRARFLNPGLAQQIAGEGVHTLPGLAQLQRLSVPTHARYVSEREAMRAHEVRLALPAVGEGARAAGTLVGQLACVRACVTSLRSNTLHSIWRTLKSNNLRRLRFDT